MRSFIHSVQVDDGISMIQVIGLLNIITYLSVHCIALHWAHKQYLCYYRFEMFVRGHVGPHRRIQIKSWIRSVNCQPYFRLMVECAECKHSATIDDKTDPKSRSNWRVTVSVGLFSFYFGSIHRKHRLGTLNTRTHSSNRNVTVIGCASVSISWAEIPLIWQWIEWRRQKVLCALNTHAHTQNNVFWIIGWDVVRWAFELFDKWQQGDNFNTIFSMV